MIVDEPLAYQLSQGTWAEDLLLVDRVRLPVSPDAPALARRAMQVHLRGLCTPRELEVMKLLTSELTTNALYAANGGGDGCIVLHYAVTADRMRVEVCDPGPGLRLARPRRPDQAGGFGLQIVQELAAAWGHSHTEGSCVWFELGRETAARENVFQLPAW